MRIAPFPGLRAAQLFGRRVGPAWLERPGAQLVHLARTGIYQAARGLVPEPGSRALLPAFHCGVEVEAVRAAGLTIDYYPVRSDLGIDPAAVEDRVRPQTRLLVVVHYFGMPQAMEGLVGLAKRRGIALLEDCAHVFVGLSAPGGPGTHGDAAVFSLTKYLPVPDGGVLILRRPAGPAAAGGGAPWIPIAKRTARLGLEGLYARHPGLGRFVESVVFGPLRRMVSSGAPAGYDPGASRFVLEVANAPASGVTRRIVARIAPESIGAARRRNFDALVLRLQDADGWHPVFSRLPDGACPLVLPARVPDRERVQACLERLGVSTFVFGKKLSHDLSSEEYPEAFELAGTILGVPVHQDLGSRDLEFLADSVRRCLGRDRRGRGPS